MNILRLFFAIWLPVDLRERLWQSLAPLRRAGPGVRWIPPQRYHITLRFLGDVSAGRLPLLTAAADTLAKEEAFRVDFTRTGVFPPRGSPRVHWVGMATTPLTRIRMILDRALTREGIAPERRAFAPHMTVGRVRGGRGRTGPGVVAGAGPTAVVEDDGFMVDEVHLVRSELFPAGPQYANIHRVVLTGQQE